MRPKLFILFLFISSISFSQQSFTSDQINRLAQAGKLWGYIKYYHPYLQYKDISWDSAFIATVPDILEAKNEADYEKSIIKFLAVLKDPVTAVIHRHELTTAIKYPTFEITDSVMLITIWDCRSALYSDSTDKIFNRAKNQLKKIRSVIIDLRPDKETFLLNDEVPLEDIFENTELLSSLYKSSVTFPSIRTVTRNAFVTETPENNSNYQSLFLIRRLSSLTGDGDRDIPVVFIINKYSALPMEALALQSVGKAAIIQEEGSGEIGIAAAEKFYISDRFAIRTRVSEILHTDNGLGFHPNLTVPESGIRSTPVEKAKQILKNGIQPYQPTERVFSGFTSINNKKSLTKKSYPSVGERVLAAAKIYSVLKFFYPNKQLWTHNWDSVYLHFLPRFVLAQDSVEYVRTVMEMYPYVQDGHGFIQHPLVNVIRNVPPQPGLERPPFQMRLVENQLVITLITNDSLCKALGIKKGDIILERDGKNVISDINGLRKYFSASNYDAQSGYITSGYLCNPVGKTMQLKLKDASGLIKNIQLPFLKSTDVEIQKKVELNRKGNDKPILYFISKDIGYANLGALLPGQVDSMFNLFLKTKAIIFDVRAHPRAGPIYSISPRLVRGNRPSKRPMRILPGWAMEDDWQRNRKKGVYKGLVVGLMHENTQSHGEVTAETIGLFGTLIGNHTAGANGDVVSFYVPGEIRLTFSGGAAWMQGKGIQPDILITPTIKGIQQGRDEILERAIKLIETGK